MSSATLSVALAAVSCVLAAVAAFFAFLGFRTGLDARAKADRRWDDALRPQPHLSFTVPPNPGQPIELEVENFGGAMASGAIVAEYGEDIYACELTLPDKAAPRRILVPAVMKAWQKANKPGFLMVAGRDVSGRWWNCLDGMGVIKDPKRWADASLREMRLTGAVSFPELTGVARKG
jgi:hypothetical protein